MNKRFSTLVAAALVAGGLSANAQVLSDTDLKTGDFVFLKTSSSSALVIKNGKLDSTVVAKGDTAIARLDSMAWKVTVTKGTAANTYKFQNRATGAFLSLDAETGAKHISADSDAITEWGYSTSKGVFANVGDSAYTVKAKTGFVGLIEANTKSTTLSTDANIVAAYKIDVKMNLSADDFNNYIKGFNFVAPTGRTAKKDVSEGQTNVLTKKTWVAKAAGISQSDTLFFQVKDAKDNTQYLAVDTAFIAGSKSFKFVVADSLQGKEGTNSFPSYVKDKKTYYSRNDTLAMFKISYVYANDSLIIKPVALPNKENGKFWRESNAVTKMFGVAGQDSAMVALKTLEGVTILAIDSVNYAQANLSEAGDNGLTIANIHSTARTAELGGNAEIDAKKVYFIKYAGKADKDKAGKYVVAKSLVGATTEKAYQTAKGNVAVPSSQWVVKAGNAKGLYTIENREFDNITFGGAFTQVMDGKEKVANTYVVNNDTILLEDANCASVENLITVDKHKRATTGYGYYDPAVLGNKKFKVASASPFMKDLFMQAKKDSSITLAEDENLFYLEKVGEAKFGAEVAGIDTLYRYTYKFVTKPGGKGAFIARNSDNTAYILTKNPKYTASVFYFKSWGAADTYMMIDTTGVGATPTWSNAYTVSVNAQNADIYPAALSAAKSDLFTVAELDAPSVLFTNPTHYNIYNNNDRLAVGKNNLAVMAQPGNDLKADADKFVNDNFTLWFDTVNYKADITASYFISQGIKAAAGEETKAEEASAERLYLTVASEDSTKKSDDLAKLYKLDDAYRLYFRTAVRHGVDTLIVNNFDEKAGVMAPDTVAAGADGTKHSADATKGLLLGGIDNFKFQFEVIDGTDNYVMKSLTNQYVVSVNGLLVAKSDSDENMIATLKAPDYATSNEDVAVSEVTVIATEGGVQIAGAAGKKVVISNILGQVVANTVLTSDNAVIAAPQGVVVVAVEGEDAVKAIVK